MFTEYLKIGEVAELLKTTIRTIRYYEEEGLLEPHRTDGGTRLYSEQHVKRLKSILHLVDNGFSIEVIRLIGSIRETCNTGNDSSKKVSAVIESEIKNINKKVASLELLKSEFTVALKQVKKCTGCTNLPSSNGCPTCPLNKKLNQIEILNLIWE
ncbi:MAG: MerR family transcriptional regulator [Candidatus Thiodiazotropha sp. (ex Monitilora ramsayi)]|nr:MerR family transcriptional regulator [Candidatus Thiodiazotropha sp. (ex Monitilora ramsayi)]